MPARLLLPQKATEGRRVERRRFRDENRVGNLGETILSALPGKSPSCKDISQ
jgi:hypothetical protein